MLDEVIRLLESNDLRVIVERTFLLDQLVRPTSSASGKIREARSCCGYTVDGRPVAAARGQRRKGVLRMEDARPVPA